MSAEHPDPGDRWRWIAAAEVAVAAAVIVADVLVPTLVVLLLAAASLLVRRARPASLGFHRLARPWRAAATILALVVCWTGLQLALLLPLLEHATGERQDLSTFEDLQGNVGLLAALLVASWTLAAVGEETVYRGYVHTRVTDALGTGRAGVAAAVAVSAVLFGLAHTEQGLVGVGATFLDAIFFSALLLRYRTVWAPVFAHGMSNTIGLVAFFVWGPFHGLW